MPMMKPENHNCHVRADKQDEEKLNYALIPPGPIEEIVRVFMHGAKKYSPYNWTKGVEYSRYYSATMRHLEAWKKGEDLDPDTGLPHLAHASFYMLALMQFSQELRCHLDDRQWYPGGPNSEPVVITGRSLTQEEIMDIHRGYLKASDK